MKRLLSKLLLFLPILLAVGTVNYMVDPSQLFGSGRVEREMAVIMLSGQNVANIVNYDHRLLQKMYFESLENPAQVIVAGSSRSMLINATMFPGVQFYNASMAGASIEDYLALQQLMLDEGISPEVVVLDVSPWVFNPNGGQTRWKSMGGEFLRALARLGVSVGLHQRLNSIDYDGYAALFSLPYLQDSLRWLAQDAEFYATAQTRTGELMKLSDGSRVYSAEEEAQTAEQLRQIVRQSLAQPYAMTDFTEMDKQSMELFERVVDAWLASGTQVTLLLAPYQPEYYGALAADSHYQIIERVEEYLHQIAAERGITVMGSYNPAVIGCQAEEFYDGLHPRPSCMERIDFSRVFER
ncbi:MAG: DUF1574 family protein [Anaerolineales bacterium]|nr:DUF1574 family protein [Anaerolineales bacterium]